MLGRSARNLAACSLSKDAAQSNKYLSTSRSWHGKSAKMSRVQHGRYAAFVISLLSVGCGPAIYSFTAQPNKVCSGGAVALAWKASGEGKISITTKDLPNAVPAEGNGTFTPSSILRVHLEVSNLWGSAGRDNDVELLSGHSIEIGQSVADPSATCAGSALSVTAEPPTQSWSANAQVGGIASLSGDKHAYHIEHAGKSADLAPGTSTLAFQGTPVTGPWKLSLTLLPGEQCGTPTVPRTLGVELSTTCSGVRS